MAFSTWSEVVAVLSRATEAATATQHRLAEVAGISIEEDTPSVVASAKLRVALSKELFLDRARPNGTKLVLTKMGSSQT